jgi:hypothetical protein
MFFKTSNGVHIGHNFMSFIHTRELSGVNPFDYRTELQKHAEEVSHNPKDCMLWNYRETMAQSQGRPPPLRVHHGSVQVKVQHCPAMGNVFSSTGSR